MDRAWPPNLSREFVRHAEISAVAHFIDSQSERAPLIVISHGTGGNCLAYGTLGRHLASHGYVVIHPTHTGSDDVAMKTTAGRRIDRIRALMADPDVWRTRAAHIQAAIDAADTHPLLRGRVDSTCIGGIGHSYGAHTAMTIGGMRVTPTGATNESLLNPRVRAVIALSPPSVGRLGITPGAWDEMTTPLLVMTGTLDAELDIGDYSRRRMAFDETRGPACYALIEGADHLTFADYAPIGNRMSPPDPAHVAWINRTCEQFLNSFVRDDPAAREWFTKRSLTDESAGRCSVECRNMP